MDPTSHRRSVAVPTLVALFSLVAATLGFASVSDAANPSASATNRQYSSAAQIAALGSQQSGSTRSSGVSIVSGSLRAPGGPFLYDSYGRVILLHGVNAVYKLAPYELYPDPGQPWSFTAADARRIAGLGFNVVRLGILWQGIEPGTGSVNDPATCAAGPPGPSTEFNKATADAYLANIKKTVDLLGRYHVYSLLDMHQDVYNQAFRGEGAPSWAVCTDGVPIVALGGRWSDNYASPTLHTAEEHFWLNDVVGNLQGQYDLSWSTVAGYFSDNPWVVGYDPYNEPYEPLLTLDATEAFAIQLECFYTGTAHPGTLLHGEAPTSCPADDPPEGVIPSIQKADPHHLIFVEPDNYSVGTDGPSLLGPMNYPNLVNNFHAVLRRAQPGDRRPDGSRWVCESGTSQHGPAPR